MSQSRRPARLEAEPTGRSTSVVRLALVVLLIGVGIAWVAYYLTAVQDDGTPSWMADLRDWNWVIGFGAIFVGLALSAHPRTPLGRGRGVVVGMLGCFLLGLAWIVVYYVTAQDMTLPLVSDLGNYNLLVGIGFMAVGFVFATRWE